jgi:DNA-binding CsgD family transcriptional regulator
MNDSDKAIVEQLKLTNRLLAQILIKDSTNQTERIIILKKSGFSASDIAELLDIKLNVVTATLSNVKKSKEK